MMRRVDGGTGSLPSRLLQQPIGKATHLFQPKYQIVKRCLDFTFSLFLLLLVCPLFLAAVLQVYERGLIIPGVRLEFLLESNFLLAGVVTLLWTFL